eukprot:366406-Chlamydomonas_euryale.AAC.11
MQSCPHLEISRTPKRDWLEGRRASVCRAHDAQHRQVVHRVCACQLNITLHDTLAIYASDQHFGGLTTHGRVFPAQMSCLGVHVHITSHGAPDTHGARVTTHGARATTHGVRFRAHRVRLRMHGAPDTPSGLLHNVPSYSQHDKP